MTSGSNITVHGNTINDSAYGVYHNAGASDSGVSITANTINRCNQHIAVATAGFGNAISGTVISNNNLTNAVNWDDGVTDTFHHNGIFVFQGWGGTITNTSIYDNTIGGDFGVNDTSYIFIDPNGGTITSTAVFNNLLLNGSTVNGPANGFITGLGTGGGAAYNNTIFCNGAGFAAIKTDSPSTLKNNIISTCLYGIYVNSGTSLAQSDYNVVYGVSNMYYNATTFSSVAAWTAATGFDSHSVVGNPGLNTDGTLRTGSAAVTVGANLAILGIPPLNSDYSGTVRPSAAAWDAGAYTHAGAVAPAPPTNLSAAVH